MTFLKNVAKAQNIAVVCTIRSPASVFAGFDNVMVLSMGGVACPGKAAKMNAYLASVDRPPPIPTRPSSSSTSSTKTSRQPPASGRCSISGPKVPASTYGCS